MTILNTTKKLMMLARSISAHPTTPHGRHRAFLTEAAKNLQKLFDGRPKKEQNADEACEKALEAAESLKEGTKEVKETCEIVRDTATTTSETVTNVAREITEKVTEAADATEEKMKEPVKGFLSDAWGVATKKIEDKMVEKIRCRVLGEDAQNEVKDMHFGKN